MPRTFKLLETLGEGAFGAVHLAEISGDEGFVQRLAVKWLHPQWSHEPELAKRLRDEARLLALLNHDHIVRVHGLTRLSGRLAILMEAIEGVDLSRLGKDEAVPPLAAVEIVEAVADALDAAWQTTAPGGVEPLRVVHRDIKPSNIMVTPRGGVKVMDFGVARATFDAREAQTRSQQYGTARYMAPERWLEGIAAAPSDVFSLGITMIELVSGESVERPRLLAEAFREDIGRAVARLERWPAIRALAEKMTAYEPAARPTAGDVVLACREIAKALPGPSLRDWAAGWVADNKARRASTADGTLVQEDASAETFDVAVPPGTEPLAPTGSAPLPMRQVEVALTPALPPPQSGRWSSAMFLMVGVGIAALIFAGWTAFRAELRGDTAPVASAPTADTEAASTNGGTPTTSAGTTSSDPATSAGTTSAGASPTTSSGTTSSETTPSGTTTVSTVQADPGTAAVAVEDRPKHPRKDPGTSVATTDPPQDATPPPQVNLRFEYSTPVDGVMVGGRPVAPHTALSFPADKGVIQIDYTIGGIAQTPCSIPVSKGAVQITAKGCK